MAFTSLSFLYQWFEQILTDKGSCFTFNSDSELIEEHLLSLGLEVELRQDTAGERFGLTLVLDAQTVKLS